MSNPAPSYYDSQASAAAALGIDIYELRQAKQEGCPAFRSGRVYRAPLLAWLAERPAKRAVGSGGDDDGPEPPNLTFVHWDARRDVLLELVSEFLGMNLERGQISAAEYAEMGRKSLAPIFELGRAWGAGIDEQAFRQFWTGEFRRVQASGKAAPHAGRHG